MVNVWLSMNDEERERAKAKDPTLNTLSLALQDIGCSDVMAQIQAEAGHSDEHDTSEGGNKCDPEEAASSKRISAPIDSGIPRSSSGANSKLQELKGKIYICFLGQHRALLIGY